MTLLETYKLYDRVIKFSIGRNTKQLVLKNPWKSIDIGQTSGSGYKPAIEVSVTMLPNSICLQMTVRVTNMVMMQDINVRDYGVMAVTMGYPGNTMSFTGPIFSSYLEKPNPNGVIVFEGVVCGESGKNLFSPRPYILKFWQKTNLKGFVDKICKGITENLPYGSSLTPDYSMCDPSLLYEEMDFQEGEYTADNAYAVLNWAQDIIYRWGRVVGPDTGDKWTTANGSGERILQAVLKGEKLYIIDSHCAPTPEDRRHAIQLTAVKSASYTGPVLNVSAPYNPKVEPGSIFYMPPYFYKGGQSLPNLIGADVFNADNGLYRVIKMDIQFATFGNTNEMTLMAIPASMYEGEVSTMDTQLQHIQDQIKSQSMSPADIAAALTDSKAGETEIVWGNPIAGPENSNSPKSMWSVSYNPTNASKQRIGYDAETGEGLKGINTLSQLAEKMYGTKKFYLPDSKLSTPFKRNSPDGVELMYFFPLIMVATYKAMNMPGGKGVYWIDTKNPDMVYADYYVSVPALTVDSAKELIGNQQVATIFQSVAEFYKESHPSWAAKFEDIYNYITKGQR